MSMIHRRATRPGSSQLARVPRVSALVAASLCSLCACGSGEPERVSVRQTAREDVGADDDGPGTLLGDEAAPSAPDGELCAVQRIPLREVPRPIDVILVLDNSVSMALELDAVERSINRNFASVLEARGVDYRVILLSRHRTAERASDDAARTAICITQPLSALERCPAPRPGQTDRFHHYSIDIDSTDSLSRIIDTLGAPDPSYGVTEVGWREWLREGSRKVFLEVSDDDSLDNGRDFTRRLMSRAPEHFGTDVDRPEFVFHSIVGVAEREPAGTAYAPEEPIVRERCAKNGRPVASSGPEYQALSRVTGGLRYPLCALDDYAAIFEGIARDGVRLSGLACSLPLPPAPAGKILDTRRIELSSATSGEGGAPLERVESPSDCSANAFYVDGNQIELCPGLCDALADARDTTVSVEFDCSSYLDVR